MVVLFTVLLLRLCLGLVGRIRRLLGPLGVLLGVSWGPLGALVVPPGDLSWATWGTLGAIW
eukprot:6701631-Pyramimonas_sp.AAC.1